MCATLPACAYGAANRARKNSAVCTGDSRRQEVELRLAVGDDSAQAELTPQPLVGSWRGRWTVGGWRIVPDLVLCWLPGPPSPSPDGRLRRDEPGSGGPWSEELGLLVPESNSEVLIAELEVKSIR